MKKIKLKTIILLIIIILIMVPIVAYYITYNTGIDKVLYSDVEETISNLEHKDYAIVPGASVYEGQPLSKGRDRLNTAIKLYNDGKVDMIIVSGGDKTEVDVMINYLYSNDVKADDVLADYYGVETYETIARVKEKLNPKSVYFCTQDMYSTRAAFLMEIIGIEGNVLTVDTIYYNNYSKSQIREFFASSKALMDTIIYRGKSKISITQQDFSQPPTAEKESNHQKDDSHMLITDVETPKDYKVEDINPNDEYDVKKAVEYARKYALISNAEYPRYEQNCTNFVSQCLLEGGIAQEGAEQVSDSKRFKFTKDKSKWFCINEVDKDTKRTHYSTSYNFLNTDMFIEYFTEDRGYKLSVYNNDYDGRIKCYNDLASGDVLIFYGEDGGVVHIGLVTGMGDMNAYYCANTNAKLDYGIFTINDKIYKKFGVLHMSGQHK